MYHSGILWFLAWQYLDIRTSWTGRDSIEAARDKSLLVYFTSLIHVWKRALGINVERSKLVEVPSQSKGTPKSNHGSVLIDVYCIPNHANFFDLCDLQIYGDIMQSKEYGPVRRELHWFLKEMQWNAQPISVSRFYSCIFYEKVGLNIWWYLTAQCLKNSTGGIICAQKARKKFSQPQSTNRYNIEKDCLKVWWRYDLHALHSQTIEGSASSEVAWYCSREVFHKPQIPWP